MALSPLKASGNVDVAVRMVNVLVFCWPDHEMASDNKVARLSAKCSGIKGHEPAMPRRPISRPIWQ